MRIGALIVIGALTTGVEAHADDATLREPMSSVHVLVDLSATWLTKEQNGENERVLAVIGDAIVTIAADAQPPIVIRHLAVGDASLARPPLCEAQFLPAMLPRPGQLSDLRSLERFLRDCDMHILSRPQEQFTDLTGALDSVSRATHRQTGRLKLVIVLSDFKEERRPGQSGTVGDLSGARILLLYRVLPSDRRGETNVDERVAAWEDRLDAAGAMVTIRADAYVTANDILSALGQ